MSAAHVRWDRGGEASVVEADGMHLGKDALTLRSSVPAPPGSRLEGALAGEPPERIKIKVHSSRRQEDGAFLVAGRLIDATRELRARVAELAPGSPLPGSR
jgi:hypothetical protein